MAGRDGVEAMQEFISSTGVDAMRHVADLSGDIWESYEIASQPAWVFINDDGSSTTLVSALGEDRLIEQVELLLGS